jgi:probable F420-dependent oxidoreductase
MHISITVPVGDPRRGPGLFAEIEGAGYDRAFSFESDHDPFIPLAAAAATTTTLELGTAVAIGFARNPMVLANIGHDMQLLTEGRFVLGLGSQIRPHIENRFSEVWSRPAARMKEMVSAVRAIWERWEGKAPLDFQGEFYRHTLMTPAFDPGPNEYGTPPIFVGGFGPKMVSVAGEVADGLIVHPFTSRRSMEEVTLPALEEGLRRSGRTRADVQVVWVTMLVVWDDLHGRDEAIRSAREQLAFYGSTPAYRPVLEVHGWDGLQPELNRLSKEGRWDEMTALIPEELVDALAVVAPRDQAAARLVERVSGITEHLSLVNNRHPDPGHFADVVADLRRLTH